MNDKSSSYSPPSRNRRGIPSILKTSSSRRSRISRDRHQSSGHNSTASDEAASVLSVASTIHSARSFTQQQLTTKIVPLDVSAAGGSARPPSRRVDFGDEEVSVHARPIQKKIETLSSSPSATIVATDAETPDFSYLVGNESIISYTSHSTWDELDWLSCSHSVGTATTVSGRRPPPPNKGQRGSWMYGNSGNDSIRSFASYSARGGNGFCSGDSVYGDCYYDNDDDPSLITSTTIASTSNHVRGNDSTQSSHAMTAGTPPYLVRNTTQSSARRFQTLERQDSIQSLSSSGILMVSSAASSLSPSRRSRDSNHARHSRGPESMIIQTRNRHDRSVGKASGSRPQQRPLPHPVQPRALPGLPFNADSSERINEHTTDSDDVSNTSADLHQHHQLTWQPKCFSFRPFRRVSM